jgi:hypothetical protein
VVGQGGGRLCAFGGRCVVWFGGCVGRRWSGGAGVSVAVCGLRRWWWWLLVVVWVCCWRVGVACWGGSWWCVWRVWRVVFGVFVGVVVVVLVWCVVRAVWWWLCGVWRGVVVFGVVLWCCGGGVGRVRAWAAWAWVGRGVLGGVGGGGGVVWGGCRMFCALGLVFGVGVCVWVCFCVRILKKIGGVTCIANVRGVVLAADWGC